MDTQAIDRDIDTLQANKLRWARLPLGERIQYLEGVLKGTAAVAERQVAAAIKAKGIPADSPLVGEEWLGGPVVQARTIRLVIESLRDIHAGSKPRIPTSDVRVRADGQTVVQVFPRTTMDKLTFAGFRAEVWQSPGVTPQNLADNMAGFYDETDPKGAVALVLGAGNVASIGPLDMIQKLFFEGQVCLLKLNPVNEYLGPFVEETFADLIQDGFVRTVYGGADVGEYCCQHPNIEEIHITGSDATHDAIVYGVGAAGAKRKAADNPRVDKRITSELGNVSPVIVVPGSWTESDLRFHAENIATQMGNNGGFNCNACKLIILHEDWPQKRAFMDMLRAVLATAPQRKAYYPGAQERYDRFTKDHGHAEALGPKSEGVLPWTLLPDVDPKDTENMAFTKESWCGVTAQTALPGANAEAFLKNAVAFCNDVVWGTLNAGIIIHPNVEKRLGDKVEQAIADLHYGTVTLNHWAALSYGLGTTAWGAYPGHTWNDIQSGIGFVHNALMFDRPQKSVIYGPFKVFPKPAWFITNKQTDNVAKKMLEVEMNPSLLKVPSLLWSALRG